MIRKKDIKKFYFLKFINNSFFKKIYGVGCLLVQLAKSINQLLQPIYLIFSHKQYNILLGAVHAVEGTSRDRISPANFSYNAVV